MGNTILSKLLVNVENKYMSKAVIPNQDVAAHKNAVRGC